MPFSYVHYSSFEYRVPGFCIAQNMETEALFISREQNILDINIYLISILL
jgi:hypothetical protein